jgi:excisionase family DNA binding protein
MSRALPTIERRLLGYPLVAAYLGISLRGAKQLAADGEIRKILIGHRVLFDVRDLDSYIDRVKAAS